MAEQAGRAQGCSGREDGDIAIPSAINGLPVTGIGQGAFNQRSGLTSVTIPNSVTIGSSVTTIGYGAFQDCSGLTNITTDASNPSYSSLSGILFNKDKTALIQYPPGQAGAYTIPNSVTTIGDGRSITAPA